MPFVDLNSLQNSSAAGSNPTPAPVTDTTTPVTPVPVVDITPAADPVGLPPLPSQMPEPDMSVKLPDLQSVVETLPQPSTPAPEPQTILDITADATPAPEHVPGSIEFMNGEPQPAAAEPVQMEATASAAPAPVLPSIADSMAAMQTVVVPPTVVEAPAAVAEPEHVAVTEPEVAAENVEPQMNVTPEPAAILPPITEPVEAIPEIVMPVIEEPMVEAAPVVTETNIPMPAPVLSQPLPMPTPAPVVTEVIPTSANIEPAAEPVSTPAEMSTAVPADQEAVLSFSSSMDAEDLDKPAVVKSPEIKVSEGVEIHGGQGGMREVVGPDFDEAPAATPLQTIANQDIDQKLAALGNVMSNPVDMSSTETSVAPELTMPVSESETLPALPETMSTDPVSLPALPVTEVAPITTAAETMAADPLDLTAVSSVPTAPLTPGTVLPAPAQAPAAAAPLPSKTYSLNDLLRDALARGASDLHLTVGYRAIARVDGTLTTIKSAVLDNEAIKAMVMEVIAGRELGDPEAIRDYDLSYSLPDGTARFRVNIFRQQESMAMVLRLIPARIQSIDSLKLPPVIRGFTKFSSGLVLFTGPTGSGKSTTIASLLNEINMNEPRHIITVEDPVEYVYPKGVALIDQREIFTDTQSWTDALRSVLRQDPDVVLIGEMRDLETIAAAIRVAETGHLVFATLHTNNAPQSVDRIIDVFPEGQQTQIRTQLASVIQAIVSQRLVPITGGGRRVATEILVATPAVRNAIRDDKVYQINNMIQTSAELGMITMEKSLVGLVREGLISTEMAQEYANNPSDVLTLLGQNTH